MKSACVLPGGVERTEIRKEFRDRLREQSLEPAPFASITGVLHFMIYAFVERRVYSRCTYYPHVEKLTG